MLSTLGLIFTGARVRNREMTSRDECSLYNQHQQHSVALATVVH